MIRLDTGITIPKEPLQLLGHNSTTICYWEPSSKTHETRGDISHSNLDHALTSVEKN